MPTIAEDRSNQPEPAAPEKLREERHIQVLDGLRALAILLVLFHHCVCYDIGRNALDRAFYVIARSTWCGVDLFFVLSGFLITGILWETKKRVAAAGGGAKAFFFNFYARRTLRIFPPYYLLLAVSFLLIPRALPGFTTLEKQQLYSPWVFVLYLQNIFIAHRQVWPGPMLTPTWSLAVEEQFYLGWPLLIFIVRPRAFIKITALCLLLPPLLRVWIALHAGGNGWIAAYTPTWTRMDALAMGALIAALPYAGFTQAALLPRLRVAGVIAGVCLLGLFFTQHGLIDERPWVYTLGFTCTAVFSGWMLLASVFLRGGTLLHRALKHPILMRIGQWSYTIYLVHHPIREALRQYVWHFKVPLVAGSQALGAAWFFIVMTSLSAAVAAASWYAFEQPILKLKKYFPR